MKEEQGHAYTKDHRLIGEALLLDFGAEGQTLLAEARQSSQGRAARTLAKQGALRLTLLALRAGGVLAEHRAAGPVAIQVLTGAGTIRVGTVVHRLAEQQAIVLEPDVVHSVEADGDTLILLTIALTG